MRSLSIKPFVLPLGILILTLLYAPLSHAKQDHSQQSLNQLEKKLQAIDAELATLANHSLRGGIGAIGYRFSHRNENQNSAWIQIDWQQPETIDLIVLVPTIWRDSQNIFEPRGFPVNFRILAGTQASDPGTVLAQYSAQDDLKVGIAPFLIPINPIEASWIRIEINELDVMPNQGIVRLAECFVFSGAKNVALQQSVSSSSNQKILHCWDQSFLVDGFMPYFMDAAQGEGSLSYVSEIAEHHTLSVDLEESHQLTHIHIHMVEQNSTVPEGGKGNFGIPKNLRIEGANMPDFSDATLLLEYQLNSSSDAGPIIMRNIFPSHCRYLRFFANTAAPSIDINIDKPRIGFAEIELFANDINVALGKQFTANTKTLSHLRPLNAITDGSNLYGKILPIRQWLSELARRQELKVLRPLILQEISNRYAQQKSRLRLMSWLAGIFAFIVVCVILIERNLRIKQANRIKERFAADLHDELGANLHALGILCDLAQDSIHSPDQLQDILQRTRTFTESSGKAAHYCTNILEAEDFCEDLVHEMKRLAARLLIDFDHQISFTGESTLQELKTRRRIDLYLFYKECLTNILRHSGATEVFIKIEARDQFITLNISDNGQGLPSSPKVMPPPSLKRRAKLMRAQIFVENLTKGGCRITLKLRKQRFIFGRSKKA